jgi:hypothetical protein
MAKGDKIVLFSKIHVLPLLYEILNGNQKQILPLIGELQQTKRILPVENHSFFLKVIIH